MPAISNVEPLESPIRGFPERDEHADERRDGNDAVQDTHSLLASPAKKT
jgi:hypothetical protein